MLDRSWKQLMICLTANPGNDRAAVTAARDIPLSSPADSGTRSTMLCGKRTGSIGHSLNCFQSSAYSDRYSTSQEMQQMPMNKRLR
eukprot:CAMPEP_0206142524 /NCGR_PEP_ID=MMETSP1473-20131121/17227_1 /ASSEMBLY_ACC=CAM_ASM_001109 /TAXON_ID=1461547 /ORGANISM="Stichococcus sp, Strain RCC1054" /LENGTH=85 /DNA_ID=CAMNT_0053537561 /DNA_START=406 /DNA_END=663 /DNA_ORIENTATION=-